MKHFTIEWWMGTQANDDDPDVVARYAAHIASLKDSLPPHIAAIDTANLHDARLRELHTDFIPPRITMLLDMCAPDGGLVPVRLTFTGITALEFAADLEKGLPGSGGFGDFGYWELDLAGAAYEFRGLFSSGVEMIVRFADASLEEM